MNLTDRIRKRELIGPKRDAALETREFYSEIYPTKTSFNVLSGIFTLLANNGKGSSNVFRRFTPDGKFLISFAHQHQVEVFMYDRPCYSVGSTNSNTTERDMAKTGSGIIIDTNASIQNAGPSSSPNPPPFSQDLESEIPVLSESRFQVLPYPEPEEKDFTFQSYFKSLYSTVVTTGPELLATDFCLITDDCCYMILASALPTSLSTAPGQKKRNPNFLTCIPSLDDITFHVIHISTGIITSTYTLHADYIYLSNHSGVTLYDDILAITSVQYQTIHFLIMRDGKLMEGMDIGWMVGVGDEIEVELQRKREEAFLDNNALPQPQPQPEEEEPPIRQGQGFLCGIKQRIMSFLYEKARATGRPESLTHFHLTFSYFAQLVMWRAQFLDSEHILIKYGHVSTISRPDPSSTFTAFFVIYHIPSTKVIGVFDNGSEEMLKLYTEWDLRAPPPPNGTGTLNKIKMNLNVSIANNKYARESMWRSMYAIRKAKNGGYASSIKRVLSGIPFNPQSFSDSAYFDLNLFSFDEKVLNTLERLIDL